MGGITPAPWSLPYPTGTDRVMDGDNAIQALAEKVAAQWGRMATGAVTVNTVANSNVSFTVTWPVGRFTGQPIAFVIVSTDIADRLNKPIVYVTGNATSGTFSINANGNYALGTFWLAVQLP